jgi:hypothetical protein
MPRGHGGKGEALGQGFGGVGVGHGVACAALDWAKPRWAIKKKTADARRRRGLGFMRAGDGVRG